jgi:Fe2+ transport system protein FeoA
MNMQVTNEEIYERLMRMGIEARYTPQEELWDLATKQIVERKRQAKDEMKRRMLELGVDWSAD